jgi:site-specific DNA-methyltransferase (adenine-specific)
MKEFKKDNHKIFLGNTIDVLKNKIPDNSIDLIFIDPPYNIGKVFNGNKEEWESEEIYLNWCYEWLDLCIDKLKDSGSMYVMNATQNIPFIDIYLRKRTTILSRIMWHYDSSGVQAKKYYGSLYEPILFAVKNKNKYNFNYEDIMVEASTGSKRKLIDYRGKVPKPYNTKKVPGNTWYYPRVRYRMAEYEEHPSQKPEALLERVIKASSNEGDVVLDPFSGTFTTSAVAKKLNRKSIGIEIEEEYVKTGIRRLGIQHEYNGEILQPIIKNTVIKNKKNKTDDCSGQELLAM